MISKVDIIKNRILETIKGDNLAPDTPLPSRHDLMTRYDCARATVDLAIRSLIDEGYAYGVRGSGTFVAKQRTTGGMTKLFVVDDYRSSRSVEFGLLTTRIASEAQAKGDCAILRVDDVELRLGELTRPGVGVIWVRPNAPSVGLINYLANAQVPQLLIGRPYPSFSHVATDAEAGIRKGLKHLKDNWNVSSISMIASESDPMLPYTSERQISFYRSCVELELKVPAGSVSVVRKRNEISCLNEFARKNFKPKTVPFDALFVPNVEMLVPLMSLAENFEKRPGKDFQVLSFDDHGSFTGVAGVAMLRQRWGRMGRMAVDWYFKEAAKNQYVEIKIEPKLVNV